MYMNVRMETSVACIIMGLLYEKYQLEDNHLFTTVFTYFSHVRSPVGIERYGDIIPIRL